MPNTFSVRWAALGCVAAAASSYPSSGVSGEAEFLEQSSTDLARHAERSEALFGGKAQVLTELAMLASECSQAGWDGYDALPVSAVIAKRTADLIRALPADVSMPSIAAQPDAGISLEWSRGRLQTAALSVDAVGRVSYAWILGDDRGHAAGTTHAGQLSPRILEVIRDADHGHLRNIRPA